MKRDAIAIKEGDNVATALRDLGAGETVSVGIGDHVVPVTMAGAVEFAHKLALADLPAGQDILKYGEVIGRATVDIPKGAHVHVHNIESLRGRGDLA
ncbi:MAG: UxaA family hydrolase [Rhodospirillaceae bacterium]